MNQRNCIYKELIHFFPHFQLMGNQFSLHLAPSYCTVTLTHHCWMGGGCRGQGQSLPHLLSQSPAQGLARG